MTQTLDREKLVSQLMWNNGGTGMGICPVGGMFVSLMTQRIIPSAVAVSGPADKYTDEELEKLIAFAERRTVAHKKICGEVLSSDNLTCIDKRKGTDPNSKTWWFRKRVSWTIGPMYSPTLDEAIAFMEGGN